MSLNLGINNLSLLGGYGVTGGLSSFGGLFGMNNSIFTNCFGEINYDAVAGYQVANVVGNIAFAAIGQAIGNKQAAKAEHQNNQEEIEKINKEIQTKNTEKSELETENTDLNEIVKIASDKSTELAGKIESKNSEVTTLQAEYDKMKSDPEADTTALANKLNELNKAKEELEELKAEKEEQDQIVEDKNKEIETNNEKIEKLNSEIEELKSKRDKLQNAVNEVILDRADGRKLQKTKAEDFNNKWNDDGSAKDTEFTKGDMRYAIAGFRNATTDKDKKAWANKIATIFDNMSRLDITSDFKAARKIVDEYVG